MRQRACWLALLDRTAPRGVWRYRVSMADLGDTIGLTLRSRSPETIEKTKAMLDGPSAAVVLAGADWPALLGRLRRTWGPPVRAA